MTVSANPPQNGQTHERNGHAPASPLAEPLDAVSTVDGSNANPKPAAEKPAAEGRTAKGTFAPGNQFARGNPHARKMAALRAALLETATVERMKALGEKLYERAMAGDLPAAKLLLAYAIGKAPEAVNADRLDLDEWSIAEAMPTASQFLRVFVDSLNVADAVAFRGQARNGANDPQKLIERLLEEERNRKEYSPPGPLLQGLVEERKAHIGK
jgi:hypothetical protein